MGRTLTPEEMHTAQVILTLATAAFVGSMLVPRYGRRLRAFVLVAYLIGIAGFLFYLFIR